MDASTPSTAPSTADADVVEICRDLIRIDTTNHGGGRSVGEPEAAELCAAWMRKAGMEPELIESAPGRVSVVGQLEGWDPEAPGLVLHGHTDVVPAEPDEWTVDPFGAEFRDGMIWGRGAVDMKGMDAMILSVLVHLARTGRRPRRPVVVAFFSDEEAGGVFGAQWLVAHRPELFAGCTEAISEVGGFSTDVAGTRAYLVQTGEKGLAWLNLRAQGAPGHGSAPHTDNAVTRLAGAMERIGRHPWPLTYTKTTRQLLEEVAEITGTPFDERDPTPQLQALGHARDWVAGTLRTSSNPTGLTAGYKHNVIPDAAVATIDVRTLPGQEDAVLAEIQGIVGDDIVIDISHRDIGLEVPFAGELVEAMVGALGRHDPGVPVVPYLMGGGTDNKALAELGIAGYGFAPLRLPADLDFTGMFHGVDERVPIDALVFGQRVLTDLLRTY